MLLPDTSLRSWERAVRRARYVRWLFQSSAFIALVLITLLVASFGAHRVASAYAFALFTVAFGAGVVHGLARIESARYAPVAAEYARAAPFAALVAMWIGWIAIDEWLLGTGALSAPFGLRTMYALSALLFGGSIVTTLRHVEPSRVLLVLVISLLFPTEGASPRVAAVHTTLIRVVTSFVSLLALMQRTERWPSPQSSSSNRKEIDIECDGGLSSSVISTLYCVNNDSSDYDTDGDDDNIENEQNVDSMLHLGIASRSSARTLAQVGWMLVAWPPLLIVAPALIILNYIVARTTRPTIWIGKSHYHRHKLNNQYRTPPPPPSPPHPIIINTEQQPKHTISKEIPHHPVIVSPILRSFSDTESDDNERQQQQHEGEYTTTTNTNTNTSTGTGRRNTNTINVAQTLAMLVQHRNKTLEQQRHQ